MKLSSIKTMFHVFGAVLCVPMVFCLIAALSPSPLESDRTPIFPLVVAVLLGGIALYCFAGAPRLSNEIARRYPDANPGRAVRRNPRHQLKATIYLGVGFLSPVLCFTMLALTRNPLSNTGEVLAGILIGAAALSPFLATWGAAHLARHRGISPNIPITIGIVGFVVVWLMPLLGILLMTIVPTVVVMSLGLSGRGRR